MVKVQGFASIVWAVAGMIVWAAHFAFVYAANAVACARGLAGQKLLGWPMVPMLVLGATALALVAVAAIAFRAWWRLDRGMQGEEGEDEPRFMVWLTFYVALLSALAILWESVPVFMIQSCA